MEQIPGFKIPNQYNQNTHSQHRTKTSTTTHYDTLSEISKWFRIAEVIAFPNGDGYRGEVKNNVPHGTGTYIFSNGCSWMGQFINGNPHREGIITTPDKCKCRGTFESCRPRVKVDEYTSEIAETISIETDSEETISTESYHEEIDINDGDVVIATNAQIDVHIIESGDRFIGEEGCTYAHGQQTGKGKYIWKNGDEYDGDWVLGKKHGNGRMKYRNGNIYEGALQDDMKHGKGKEICGEGKYKGHTYDGEYFEDKKHGYGVYVCPAFTYKGNWKNGLQHGKAEILFSNKSKYEGDIYEGKQIGNAKIRYSNDSVYDGQVVDGIPNGNGIFIDSEGVRYKGVFINGTIVGVGSQTNKGITYIGNFVQGKLNGTAILKTSQGGVQVQFSEGILIRNSNAILKKKANSR